MCNQIHFRAFPNGKSSTAIRITIKHQTSNIKPPASLLILPSSSLIASNWDKRTWEIQIIFPIMMSRELTNSVCCLTLICFLVEHEWSRGCQCCLCGYCMKEGKARQNSFPPKKERIFGCSLWSVLRIIVVPFIEGTTFLQILQIWKTRSRIPWETPRNSSGMHNLAMVPPPKCRGTKTLAITSLN